MNLFDATLDLASFAKGTEDYTVTAVSGNEITCQDLSGRISEFGGGTIWIRSGECAGQFGRIRSSSAQTVRTDDTYTELLPGDEITIGAWLEFDTQKLISAINSVLRMYKIVEYAEPFEWDPNLPWLDLSECKGLLDVRKVLIQHPVTGDPVTSHFWRYYPELKKVNIYDKRMQFCPAGNQILVEYTKTHGAVGKDDEISNQVDPLYLRYMSWLYLCRNLIQNTHKDNLISSDMYNEAKIYERDYGRLPNKALGMRTFTFPQW
jgi:hypothetical protein